MNDLMRDSINGRIPVGAIMIFTQYRKHQTSRIEAIEEFLSKEFYCITHHKPYNAYMQIYTLDKPDKFLWFKKRRFLGSLSIEMVETDSIIYVCTTDVEFGEKINETLLTKWKNVFVSIQDEAYVANGGFAGFTKEAYKEFKQQKEKGKQ